MYLEKLEIQGFKSFAHKNKLIFSGLIGDEKRGLTAIVGPNGSGKSNVADAIRWVLGEQSLKTLRGKKSEDVIFSGSDQKSQLGMAEVSLSLNNAEAANKAQSPENIETESDLDQLITGCPEIVITRRLYRSGESEYLINNSRVRLADIQMLLAKANFGQRTYSVIGQGMVENFLSASAAERKDFFDEATGVKQFQIKRDAALNKLESSYENLQQVEMLLTEIKPRLKSLTRQVEKLKRRGEIEQGLKSHQLNYYGYLWQDINQKLNTSNARFLQLEKIKLDKEKRLEKLNDDLGKIRTTDNYREINELQPKLKELESQKNQYLKQLNKLQAELELQLESQGQFDISWLNNKQSELKAAWENTRAEISLLEKSFPNEDDKQLYLNLEDVNREIAAAEKKKQQITTLEDEILQYQKRLAKLDAILEANLEIQGQFDVSWLNNKREELSAEISAIENDLTAWQSQNDPAEKAILENKLGAIQTRLNTLNSELAAINKKLQSSATPQNQSQEIGRLIEEFLAKLENISRENDLAQIKKLIIQAKTEFWNQAKTLMNGEQAEDIARVKNIQEEIISLTEERRLANDLLSEERLRLAAGNERLRLLEDKRRQLARELEDIGAKLEKAQIKFDASSLENEKKDLDKKIKAVKQESVALEQSFSWDKLQAKRQEINQAIQENRLKASAAGERLRLLQDKQSQATKEIEDIGAKIAKSQIKFDSGTIEKEKTLLNQKLSTINQELNDLEKHLDALNQAKEKEKSIMFECQQNIQALQRELNDLITELNNLRVEATRQETKLEDLETNIRNDELDMAEIKNHQTPIEDTDTEHWLKEMNSHKLQLEQIGGIDPETEKEYQETKERYDFLSGQTEDLNRAVKSLEEIIYELDLNIKERFDQEFKVISEKFNDYFRILFNGGQAKIAKLMISDAEKDDTPNNNNLAIELNPEKSAAEEKLKRIKFLKKHNAVDLAGIEIQAVPPGKKIQAVTMLSGGERALTAIALISAIISANPSPFVVLDEVDAALDESNSERLARILDDLSNKTQFIVITHNRASMRTASILYGVTMESDGVSKLLSVKIDDLKK